MPNTYDGIKNTTPAIKIETDPEARTLQDGGGIAVPLVSSLARDTAFGLQVSCGTGGETAPTSTNTFAQYWS